MLLPREGYLAAGEAPRAAGRRQSVPGGAAAGAPEAGALHAGAPNLQQAAESRNSAGVEYTAPTWCCWRL